MARGCLLLPDPWPARLRTMRAMALLTLARLLVELVPFRIWRNTLGPSDGAIAAVDLPRANRLSAHIARAASRLPFSVRCLPQAMALSWQLRSRRIPHRIVFAARPAAQRSQGDMLHAWIECGGETVIGELPGPWLVVHALPLPDEAH